MRFFRVTDLSPFLTWALTGFLLVALFCYFLVDIPLIEQIASQRKAFRPLFKAASLMIFPPLHLALWTGAFIWARFLSTQKQWTLPLFEIVTTQLTSVSFVRIFKIIIGRTRPETLLSQDLVSFKFFSTSHYFHSLPSGHTMTAFTLATSFSLLFPRLRMASFALALLLSTSRVYLLDHFPSDLFATAAIGILIAQIVHLVIKKLLGLDTDPQSQKRSCYSGETAMDPSIPPEITQTRKSAYPIHPLILSRWSPRSMTGDPITDEELMSLLEAAHWAPSSYNAQPWRFIYAKQKTADWDRLYSLLIEFNQKWTSKASVLILVISHKVFEKNNKPSITHSFDTGAAWAYLALQGSASGLVVHGMQGFDYERARVVCKIPDDYQVEAMIAVGKRGKRENLPEDMQKQETPSGRKPLSEVVMEGVFK